MNTLSVTAIGAELTDTVIMLIEKDSVSVSMIGAGAIDTVIIMTEEDVNEHCRCDSDWS